MGFWAYAPSASAQAAGAALGEARKRLVCGTGTPVSAVYLPGGLLKVTCRGRAPGEGPPSELQAGITTTPVTAGVIIATVIAVIGTGGTSGTTTTTSTGN